MSIVDKLQRIRILRNDKILHTYQISVLRHEIAQRLIHQVTILPSGSTFSIF